MPTRPSATSTSSSSAGSRATGSGRARSRSTVAEQALRACGYEPTHIVTGGASDANSFRSGGFPCVCLADGAEHNHEPTERISVDALEGMFEVAIAVVDEAGRALASGDGGGER